MCELCKPEGLRVWRASLDDNKAITTENWAIYYIKVTGPYLMWKSRHDTLLLSEVPDAKVQWFTMDVLNCTMIYDYVIIIMIMCYDLFHNQVCF